MTVPLTPAVTGSTSISTDRTVPNAMPWNSAGAPADRLRSDCSKRIAPRAAGPSVARRAAASSLSDNTKLESSGAGSDVAAPGDEKAMPPDLVGRLFSEFSNGASTNEDRTGTVSEILKRTDRCFGFLATSDGVAIGIAMATEGVAIFAGGAYGQITELYVAPAFRSRGVAALLVQRVVALGRERGWRRIDVGAPPQPEWRRSVQFYVREGFVEVGPRLKRIL